MVSASNWLPITMMEYALVEDASGPSGRFRFPEYVKLTEEMITRARARAAKPDTGPRSWVASTKVCSWLDLNQLF